MASRRGALTGSVVFALFFHFYLFGLAKQPGPVPTVWIIGVIVGWLVGFALGWMIQPKFVSRQKRYTQSAYAQFTDRVVMGLAWAGGIGMLLGIVLVGITKP